jgi:NAD-dependent dihydropyrimidine dehydrogenase PreA subunit
MFDSKEVHQTIKGEKNPPGFSDFRRTERGEVRGGEGRHQPTFDSYTETTLRYYPDRCVNCRRCIQVCPHGVFAEGEERADLIRPAACMECGACALNCPVQAIEVQSGVGCAWAMIAAALRGKDMDSTECSCGEETASCCGKSREESSSNGEH